MLRVDAGSTKSGRPDGEPVLVLLDPSPQELQAPSQVADPIALLPAEVRRSADPGGAIREQGDRGQGRGQIRRWTEVGPDPAELRNNCSACNRAARVRVFCSSWRHSSLVIQRPL